ncbi:MAG: hypothetical protein R3E79_09555 [Caldilineaceae bacterium]
MREITFIEATCEALATAMEQTRPSLSWAKALAKRGGNFATTVGLYERFGPERLCDTPICERGFVGLATGAAMTGT